MERNVLYRHREDEWDEKTQTYVVRSTYKRLVKVDVKEFLCMVLSDIECITSSYALFMEIVNQ